MPGVLFGSQASWEGGGLGHEWGVLGCCERLGKEGVMCRVSLLSRPARPKAEAKRAQEALEAA